MKRECGLFKKSNFGFGHLLDLFFVTAALREILKVLGIDIGKLLSTVVTTATEYQNTYGLIGLIILGIIMTYILELYWPRITARAEGLFFK